MMDHNARIDALRSALTHPLLVSSLVNVRYLTGFEGSNGYLLIAPDETVFVTDGRYGEVAGGLVESLDGVELSVYSGDLTAALAAVVDRHPSVGLEAEHLSWAGLRRLREAVASELVPTSGTVEALRRAKTDAEVEALRTAAAAGDAAFADLESLADGAATEGELGHRLVARMEAEGAHRAGWEPIVAAGPNAALPHHRSGTGTLGSGLLLLDYGCVVDGYHSDMSRTVWLGDRVDSEMARVHHAVLEAQEAGIAAVRPGATGKAVDEACRAVLRSYGLEVHFVHSTGHGVGLEIHENPRLSRISDDILEPGDVVTVEPGVYLPGRGGVRIEDMVLVTELGAEVLTTSPKGLQP